MSASTLQIKWATDLVSIYLHSHVFVFQIKKRAKWSKATEMETLPNLKSLFWLID